VTDASAVVADFDIAGKVAIVTGSSRGIGLGIALRLHEAGAAVMCNARHAPANDLAAEFAALHTAGPERCDFRPADVATAGGAAQLVAATLARFGRLDIVVNNAGIQPSGAWRDAEVSNLDAVIAANVRSVEAMTRAALPALEAAGRQHGAAIVNIASVRAGRPGSRMAHYSASKAAVVALTRTLAVELGPAGIRVNAVSPGLVDRPELAQTWPEGVARFRADAPLGRLGTPRNVADACLFLVSPAAGWITGVDLVVDGGISLVR
jgi:NAD(P)-dependent dehydrogenase (short-subunit alcohol dehydrogenase family)